MCVVCPWESYYVRDETGTGMEWEIGQRWPAEIENWIHNNVIECEADNETNIVTRTKNWVEMTFATAVINYEIFTHEMMMRIYLKIRKLNLSLAFNIKLIY
jgi:predicted ATPase